MGIGPNVQNRAMGELKHPKDFFSKKRVTEERNAKEILQELKRAMIVHAQVIKSISLYPSPVVFNLRALKTVSFIMYFFLVCKIVKKTIMINVVSGRPVALMEMVRALSVS